MDKNKMRDFLEVSRKTKKADLVITNGKIIDVYQKRILEGNLAIHSGKIVGIGAYEGIREIDAGGCYIAPGLMDSHIHLESTYLSVEQASKMLVAKGTTTIIADPHEIVNVCGSTGLDYMIEAGRNSPISIKYMLPSCVPACSIETSVQPFTADDMASYLGNSDIIGLGELMDYPGLISGSDDVLDKIILARDNNLFIDGHAPGISGQLLDGYVAMGVGTDHECTTPEEMSERITRGMYVQLRNGSAAKDLVNLIPGVTGANSRFCLLCSDDKEPQTVLEQGHMDDCLRICVVNGIDPYTAIQMATINIANCYGFNDRGAIAPGKKADLVFFDNLNDFKVSKVFVDGTLVADGGNCLVQVDNTDHTKVSGTMNVKGFSKDLLKLKLDSSKTVAIETIPESILTKKVEVAVQLDSSGYFTFSDDGINKIAVIERHQGSGDIGLGLIKGLNIKQGAIALTIAHDSHNVIAVGQSDDDMAVAIEHLISSGGGIAVVCDGELLVSLDLPIAGLMSDLDPVTVMNKFKEIHDVCRDVLNISEDEPVVKLSFMALPVIPEIRITPKGLFDVNEYKFII